MSELSRAQRLAVERNVWLCTVRPDGRPQTTPIWFVWVEERFWLCTTPNAVKVRNVRSNPNVTVNLENGDAPVLAEGHARVIAVIDAPDDVVNTFARKYDWNLRDPDEDGVIIEIAVRRWIHSGAVRVE